MGPISGGPINLASARLRHASLRFATLTGANLTEADLWDADLSDARLDGANLIAANLCEALLDGADFAGAKLAGANLCGASLREARNLTQGQIEEAVGDAFTLLPAQLSRPEAWTAAQVAAEPRSRNTHYSNELTVPVRQEAVQRTSWLVGGPRSGNAASRPATPQRT